MQNQQLGDPFRLDARMVLAAVDFVSRHRLQHRHPLMIVRLAPGGEPFIQFLIFDVDDPRRHLRPFEGPSGLQKSASPRRAAEYRR
jgi:hypothetical protein